MSDEKKLTEAAEAVEAKAEGKAKAEKKSSKKSDKPSVFKRFVNFLKSYKGELKKITWPTVKQTGKNTGTVLVAMIAVGAFVCLLDLGFSAVIDLFFTIG